jgi:hypothetical protein
VDVLRLLVRPAPPDTESGVNIETARTERKRVADAVTAARAALVTDAEMDCKPEDECPRCGRAKARLDEFEAAVREDERWELMARSEASPT